MLDDETVRLVTALADVDGRIGAAQRLAKHCGAAALLVLAHDRASDALVPAPGFQKTLPGGSGWRELRARARGPGVHRVEVGYPTAETMVPALAYASDGVVIVLIDPAAMTAAEPIVPFVPLLAALFHAEHEALVARGERRAAENHAREAEALAVALDAARGEVERTLIALEGQTRALEEARAHAEAGTRAKDEFLAMLGHELRNPLAPILTALQLMRLKNFNSKEQDVIERQVGNLMRLVDDLLDIARITRGQVELHKERIEVATAAARAIEMSSPELERNHQTLTVAIPAQGLPVDADPGRLSQVFANLLTNAAKYSGPGTRVSLAASSDGQVVRVRVKDEGIGIRPEMLGRVFDAFEQESQAIDRSRGGLGLGLAIVRNLVTLHGGTVTATSAGEGHGSEFVVELPVSATTADAASIGGATGDRQARVTGAGTPILVVDDNEDALALMSAALRALGYRVRTAANGPDALRIAEAFAPRVVLLDLGLPVMDGYEIARRMREIEGLREVRLLAVTGYGHAADRQRSAAAGFEAHLVKPLSLDDLQRVLERGHAPAQRSTI